MLEMEALQGEIAFRPKRTNGPLSANQVISRDKPSRSHAVCTLRAHPPTSPYPPLSAKTEPIAKGHCRK